MLAAGIQPEASFPWRHVITRALGMPCAEPDVTSEPLQPGDVYLLCSDGLWRYFPDPTEIVKAIAEHGCTAAEKLVVEAVARGGEDNATAVVVMIKGEEAE